MTAPAVAADAAKPVSRIPSLDGLRAFSIAAVLVGHLSGTRGFPGWVGPLFDTEYFDLANFGVRVFFVISGFLITGLLLDEHRRTGRVSLGQFYLRRTFRIFPAYFAFLAVVAVAASLGRIALNPDDWWHALTYTMNYSDHRSWWVGHLWSLSVEEQFYLLWPAVLLLWGPARAVRLAVAFICVAPLIRFGYRFVDDPPTFRAMIGNSFETVGDAIAVGCVLASVRGRLWLNERFARLLMSRWFVPAALLVALVLNSRVRPGLLVGTTAVNVAIGLLVERAVRGASRASGRLLNARPVVFVGQLSYSLYLWQQLFLNRNGHSVVNVFPLNLALAFLAALACYYLVEQPMLRLRARIDRARRRRHRAAGSAAAATASAEQPSEAPL